MAKMRNVVTVSANVREAAKAALDAILKVPRDY